MKRLLFIIAMLWGVAYGQSTGYLRYDTVRVQKVGGNATLIIENATKNVTGGVLTNTGGGRTQFVLPIAESTDSLFGVQDNLQTGFRTFNQSTNNFRIRGTGVWGFGDSIPGSTARVQINGSASTAQLAIGPTLPYGAGDNPYANVTFTQADTLATYNEATFRGTNFFSRKIIVANTSSVLSMRGVYGNVTDLNFYTRDTTSLRPSGADLINVNVSNFVFNKASGYTGRSVINSGNSALGFDASNAILGRFIVNGGSSGNNTRLRGYWSAVTGYMLGGNSTADTVDNYTGFLSTGGGALAPVITRGYNFIGGIISTKVDSLWGIYVTGPLSNNFLEGSLQLGLNNATGTRYLTQTAAPSAKFQVESHTKGVLLSRLPIGATVSAISAPANGLITYVRDSSNYYFYDSTNAVWKAFYNTGSGGGSGITALTGDVTASGSGSVAATLATVNSNVGSFTNANITVNAKGLITAASNGSGGGVSQSTITDTLQNYWRLYDGNTAIPGSQAGSYLGTKNNVSLRFRVNNVEKMLLDSIGRVGIGTTNFADDIAGVATQFKVNTGSMSFTFTNSGGQGWIGASNGTIMGFSGHTNSSDGFVIGSFSNHATRIRTNNANRINILASGLVGINVTTPTANLHLPASTTSASSASLKFGEGSGQTSPEDGTLNYVSNNLEFTESTTTYKIAKTLTATASLNFVNTLAQSSNELTITVAGAVTGDPVSLAIPHSEAVTGTCFTAWVSSSNTVTVRFNNYSASPIDPGSASFTVSVIHY